MIPDNYPRPKFDPKKVIAHTPTTPAAANPVLEADPNYSFRNGSRAVQCHFMRQHQNQQSQSPQTSAWSTQSQPRCIPAQEQTESVPVQEPTYYQGNVYNRGPSQSPPRPSATPCRVRGSTISRRSNISGACSPAAHMPNPYAVTGPTTKY